VVLPDGSIWDGARALIKDNAGFQLRKLFCGAEGTLGIVTKAVLRLFPAPTARATALLALPDLDAARQTGALLRRHAGEFLTAMEFFGEFGLSLALRHVEGLSRPLETPGPVYVLVEIATSIPDMPLSEILERALEAAFETGDVLDGAVAASETQRAAFWRLREDMPEGQRLEGKQIKHDVSVPVARLAAFVGEAAAAAEAVLPGVRVNPFGHLGDGNVHFNLSPPEGQAGFSGRDAELSEAIYDTVVRNEGSIAAEHGLGQAKIGLADRCRSKVERDLMRRLKAAIDPDGRMNPGKVV
jgi:FAD/FMN-containing dehydrogenase